VGSTEEIDMDGFMNKYISYSITRHYQRYEYLCEMGYIDGLAVYDIGIWI